MDKIELLANFGNYSVWNDLTVILGLPELLLSHAGEFDQCSQSLDCYLLMSQESVANSCEVDFLTSMLLLIFLEFSDGR